MRRRRLVLLGLVSVCAAIVACARPSPIAPRLPEPSCSADLGSGGQLVRLDRAGCFGECSEYEVTVCADGTVIYDGVQWVKQTGRRVRRVSPDTLRALAEVLDRAPTLDAPGRDDTPSTRLRQTRDGVTRWIGLRTPEGARVDDLVERLLGTTEWVGAPEELEQMSDELH